MKHLIVAVLTAPVAFAAADAAGGGQTGAVAEIVHFRLSEGTTEAAFLDATRAMQPLLAASPGYVSRQLSRSPDGSWTDYVVWTDLARARTAAETIFADPAAAPFGAAIDMNSVRMRHEKIMLTMD